MLKVDERHAREHVGKLISSAIDYLESKTPVNGKNLYITALKKDDKWVLVVVDNVTPTTFMLKSQRNDVRTFSTADTVLRFAKEKLHGIPVTFL